MDEARRNVLVGVFVLIGLCALGLLVVLFGRAPTWLVRGSTYPIHVHFDEVAGIRSGTLVTAKGITIGRVESVNLLTRLGTPGAEGGGLVTQESGVNVTLAIEGQFLIPHGSTAVTTEPVLGQGRPPVEIIPGPPDAPPLASGASIRGTIRKALDTVFPPGTVTTVETAMRQIGDAAEALTPVLDEVKVLLEQRSPQAVDQPGGPQGNISSAVARLDASFKHFNEVLGDPQVKSQLRDTVANARDMSDRGKKVMDEIESAARDAREVMADARKFIARGEETLATIDGRVTDVGKGLMATLDRLDNLLDHTVAIAAQIKGGEGNLGRLVVDTRLYEAMVITAERLALAVEEARALIAEWRQGKVKVTF